MADIATTKRSPAPKISKPSVRRSYIPAQHPAGGQLVRSTLKRAGFGLLPEAAKKATGGGALQGLGRQGDGNCVRPGYCSGAAASIEWLRENIARSQDINHKIITAIATFDPAIGTHSIPLQRVTHRNPEGKLRFQFGTVFLLTAVETFACDADGCHLDICDIPNVIFDIPKMLHATTVFNGNAFTGIPVDMSVDNHQLPGFGPRAVTELGATYQVIGVCPEVPAFVGINIFGEVVGKELYQEALEPISAGGGSPCT